MVRRIYGPNGMAEVVERQGAAGTVLQVGLRFARSGQPLDLVFQGEELRRLFRESRLSGAPALIEN